MSRRMLLLLLAAGALAAPVCADLGPVGGEFQVNTYTPSNQTNSAVAIEPNGNFVIVWQSGQYYGTSEDGSRDGVIARRYNGAGTAQGPGFIVPTYRAGPQTVPAVASDPLGNFVVTWQGGNYQFQTDGSVSGVFLQRFDGAGAPQGVETRVNTVTRGPQNNPSVATDAAGNFVVVWQGGSNYSFQQDGSRSGIFGQRFDVNGSPLGTEFQVNTYTTGPQRLPVVSMEPLGSFVVAWSGGSYSVDQDGDETGVFARRFDASGAPLGPEFQVNTFTTGEQARPAIASDSQGNFVVAWESGYYSYSAGQDGSNGGVFARQFDSTGAPLAAEFQVNTYTTGEQLHPHVTMDGIGNFVVVWDSRGNYPVFQDGHLEGVFGQHFAPSGVPIGPEFQVNTYTTNGQLLPRIAATPSGDFVVSWTSTSYYTGQDGSGSGIFAQRMRTTAFTPPAPVAGNRIVLRDDPDARKKILTARCDDATIDMGGGRGSIDDPTLSGGELRIRSDTFEEVYPLPAAHWRASGFGTTVAYSYRDSALLQGPVKAVRIRRGRFKLTARGAQLGHSLGTNPDPVVVVLQLGERGQRYCAVFGGTIEFRPDVVYRGRRAPAPSVCPR